MAAAKFKIGQMVCLKAAERDTATRGVVGYKILRLLHQHGCDCSYLVKTILEPDVRFAEQDELMLLSAHSSSSVTTLPQRITKGQAMTNNHIPTSSRDIHVVRGPGEAWVVAQGGQFLASTNYRLRAHAMAFARAVAHSVHADMIVHDAGGRSTRHTRASLSYPTSLD